MFPVLTGNTKDDQFAMLRFHMTKQELEKLVASGTKLENGYSSCRLSFAELMKYIGNSNNNNNPEMTGITLQDVDDYIAEEILDSEAEFASQETSTASLFGEDSAPAAEPEVSMAAEEKPAEKTSQKRTKNEQQEKHHHTPDSRKVMRISGKELVRSSSVVFSEKCHDYLYRGVG